MKQMKILRTLIILSSILFFWNPLVWGAVPQKDKQDDLFYWLWNDDDISRKAQQIVWWQARLGEAKKKKVKYRPTRTDNSPKNSVYPDDNLPRAKKNLSFTP